MSIHTQKLSRPVSNYGYGTASFCGYILHIACASKTIRSTDAGESLQAGQHHIILRTGTVNNQRISRSVLAHEYTYMRIAGIEHQIARQCFVPRDRRAIGMLRVCTTAMTNHIIQGVIKYPIHKAGTMI